MTPARPRLRLIRRDCRGTTAVEFALTGVVLLAVLFGIVDLGLLMWTHNALQSTAMLTARCAALGSCANPSQFAVTTADQWILPGIIDGADVTVQNPATSCNGTAGSFVTVTIASSHWANGALPPPLAATTLQVSACFPMAAN
jgi:Flp pilus assembly protein TadG